MTALHSPALPPIFDQLARWRDRQPGEFPSDTPPCDRLGNPSADRILAAVFQSISLERDPERQSIHLSKIATIHLKRMHGVLNAQPHRRQELQPYLQMILVLAAWNRAFIAARQGA